MSERQLSLNLFIYPNGHHEAAWRHPQSVSQHSMDIGYYQQLALRAEREKLDAIFFADSPSLKAAVRACVSGSSPSPGWRPLPQSPSASA